VGEREERECGRRRDKRKRCGAYKRKGGGDGRAGRKGEEKEERKEEEGKKKEWRGGEE